MHHSEIGIAHSSRNGHSSTIFHLDYAAVYAQADELTHKLPDFLFGFLYVWGKEKTGPSFVRWQNLRNMREIQYELCDFPTPQIRDARWPEIFWRFFTQIGSRAMPRLAWFRFYREGTTKTYQLLDEHYGRSWDSSLPFFNSLFF